MEDLLYRVRRLALDEMGRVFPDELVLRIANRPAAGTRAGAAEAVVKGILPAENGLDITIVEHQAVRTKLYDRRPNVTPFVRGDPWTNGCVAVGWMTDGLFKHTKSERLGFRMKYVNCQWTGYTLFFQRRQKNFHLANSFQNWMEEWTRRPRYGSHNMFEDYEFCYCPHNLQTSRLACENEERCSASVDLDAAKRSLDAATMLGVTEAYHESRSVCSMAT
eukprot:s414_g26.t2